MAPPAGRRLHDRTGHGGAIAQLGERVVRNDEVGGSIPPGSTTLRPSGYAWRSRARPKAKRARHSPKGDDGLERYRTSFTDTSIVSPSGYAWRSRARPKSEACPA